jgi:hypothetical protein
VRERVRQRMLGNSFTRGLKNTKNGNIIKSVILIWEN